MSSIEERCEMIHKAFWSLKRFSYPFDKNDIPLNGIYVFFEKGEFSHGCDRIVRVGTHTGNDQLRSRLIQHLVNENKDRSILRKNIGRALLSRDNNIKMLEMWDKDMTPKRARKNSGNYDVPKIKKIEEKVSSYMRSNLSFAVIKVEGSSKYRTNLESKLISTISRCNKCEPSTNWLGKFSTKPKIVESGLWLVNELYKEPFSDSELEEFLKEHFPN